MKSKEDVLKDYIKEKNNKSLNFDMAKKSNYDNESKYLLS